MGIPKKVVDQHRRTESQDTSQSESEREPAEGEVRDAKTGIVHSTLPPAEWGNDERPKKQVDLDLENLSSEATKYLGHLRKAPSKEEMQRLRAEKARRMREQNKIYEQEHPPTSDDSDDNDDSGGV